MVQELLGRVLTSPVGNGKIVTSFSIGHLRAAMSMVSQTIEVRM